MRLMNMFSGMGGNGGRGAVGRGGGLGLLQRSTYLLITFVQSPSWPVCVLCIFGTMAVLELPWLLLLLL